MRKQFTLTVSEKVMETADAVTVKFKQPAFKKIIYVAGQYITLIVKINNRIYRRPYSISSVFGIDKTLDVTIKAIENGIVSNFIRNVVKQGDIMEVMGPSGDFVLPANANDETIICWCAGSGITPVYAILRHALYTLPNSKVVLVYCNRDQNSIIFKQNLKQLIAQFETRLRVFNILSKPQLGEADHHFEGRITPVIVADICKLTEGQQDVLHYLCGPEGIINMVRGVLQQNGVEEERIFFENFYQTIDIGQLAGVVESNVLIKINDEKASFKVPFGKTILEACLDSGIDFPYSCQTGACTFCKAFLLSGAIKTVTNQHVEHPLEENECLLCCSFPLENEIYLEAKI
jgi:ring-1,2-phenylacetyl-CoA epoxidase subunit PaaE